MTRDLAQPAARALAERGVEVVEADMGDAVTVEPALRGAYGAYIVTAWVERGTDAEARMAIDMADAAGAAGVRHIVLSSVASADKWRAIPHFGSKLRVEEHLKGLGVPATIVRPVSFMENLLAPQSKAAIEAGTLAMPLRPEASMQQIAVDDIGAFVALAFADPGRFAGRTLEVAGDQLTGPQMAEALSRRLGRSVRFEPIPIERAGNPERVEMYRYINADGYRADIAEARRIHPGLMTFERWLATTDMR